MTGAEGANIAGPWLFVDPGQARESPAYKNVVCVDARDRRSDGAAPTAGDRARSLPPNSQGPVARPITYGREGQLDPRRRVREPFTFQPGSTSTTPVRWGFP